MVGTFFSVIVAILLLYNPLVTVSIPVSVPLGLAVVILGFVFFQIFSFSIAYAWNPLRKAEQTISPRLLELLHNDNHMKLYNGWLSFFCLLSFTVGFVVMIGDIGYREVAVAVWIIAFGITMDAAQSYRQRILKYLDPFTVVDMLSNHAKLCIRDSKDLELCEWIGAMTEIAFKAIQQESVALCSHTLQTIEETVHEFLDVARSFVHHETEEVVDHMDKVSYNLFYLFQRLEILNEKGIEKRLEPVVSQLVTMLGKLTIHAAHYDISLASYPLHFLGRFTQTAQDNDIDEVAIKATCALNECARRIVDEIDLSFVDIKDTFLTMISILEDIAKTTFRKDKTTNIKLLVEPLKELKVIFDDEKLAKHQDKEVIVQNIENILSEFDALEMVMQKIPPVQPEEEEPLEEKT